MKMALVMMKIPIVAEHRFHPVRKWRFDIAITDHKIAIEYEGIYGNLKSRHTNVTGYDKDMEKYNTAVVMGWRVLRYSLKTYENMVNDINQILFT